MGIGMGWGDDCGCDRSYYLREYNDLKLKYDKLEKLVNDLLDAGMIDHPIEREEQHYKAIARLQAWRCRVAKPIIKRSSR